MRLLILIAPLLSATAPADILHLRDGTRHHGALISQSPQAVHFAVLAPGGEGSLTLRFPASSVERVERGAIPDVLRTAAANAHGARPEADYEQMVREAHELAEDGDTRAALAALQKVVMRAPAETLAALDAQHAAQHGRSLAAYVAETRVRAAQLRRSPRALPIGQPSRFEAAALSAELERIERRALGVEYAGRSLQAWLDAAEEYRELHADAQDMTRAAALAAAAIGHRLKIDPCLRDDTERRATLARTRDALVRLSARVRAMPGFTRLGVSGAEPDPTLREAQRIAEAAAAASQPSDPNTAVPTQENP
jgi:hypothetical protein